ncbi:MAG: hypothetical protein AB7I37_15660 [Pirellulales bacterium]
MRNVLYRDCTMSQLIDKATKDRPAGLIPVVLPHIFELMDRFEDCGEGIVRSGQHDDPKILHWYLNSRWQYISVEISPGHQMMAVQTCNSYVHTNKGLLPFNKTGVSKIALLDSVRCHLCHVVEDLALDLKHTETTSSKKVEPYRWIVPWNPLAYQEKDFANKLAKFLFASTSAIGSLFNEMVDEKDLNGGNYRSSEISLRNTKMPSKKIANYIRRSNASLRRMAPVIQSIQKDLTVAIEKSFAKEPKAQVE